MQIKKPVQRWQLAFEGEWPTSVAFLGNSRRLAAGNRAGQIFVWELPEEAPVPEGKDSEPPSLAPSRRLDGHTNGISRLVATADGNLLISASLDHTVRLWNPVAPPSGQDQVVLNIKERERQARGKSKEQAEQILKGPGVPVEIVAPVAALLGHKNWIEALGMSRDETRLISGDESATVIVWDLNASGAAPSGKEHIRLQGHPWNGIAAAALSPDGKTAAVSEYGSKRDDFDIPAAALKLWNTTDGAEKLDLLKLYLPKLDAQANSYGSAQVWRKFISRGLIAADFSPDGAWLALGQGGETDKGQVHIFETATGKFARSISSHQYGVCDVKFSADSQYVVSSGRDTMVRICEVSNGKEIAALGKSRGGQFKDWLHAIAISPDQTTVAAADIAGMVHVWQLNAS